MLSFFGSLFSSFDFRVFLVHAVSGTGDTSVVVEELIFISSTTNTLK